LKSAYFVLMTCILSADVAQGQSSPDALSWAPRQVLPASSAAIPLPPTLAAGKPLRAPEQRFACSGAFAVEECKRDMVVLRERLDKYQAARLGEWKWVLVRSEDWRLSLLTRNLPIDIPATTGLEIRTTFFDEALVSGPIGRVSELVDLWHLSRDALLDLAVRHELGHALCNDPNERNAGRVADLLQQGKLISCNRKDKLRTLRESTGGLGLR
jgi:hypothetical protein